MDEKTYYKISAKKARQNILGILEYLLNTEAESKSFNKWPYATLANCFFGLGDEFNGTKYEEVFLSLVDVEWERKTYFDSKESLIGLRYK